MNLECRPVNSLPTLAPGRHVLQIGRIRTTKTAADVSATGAGRPQTRLAKVATPPMRGPSVVPAVYATLIPATIAMTSCSAPVLPGLENGQGVDRADEAAEEARGQDERQRGAGGERRAGEPRGLNRSAAHPVAYWVSR
jgi:hypothetical protein